MASLLIHLSPILILHHLIILLILIQIPPYSSSNDDYKDCTNPISCGSITNIGFPFWGENRPRECGHPLMQLTCVKATSYITINDVRYQVLDANPDKHTLRITRVDYLRDLCPILHVNTNLDTHLFVYDSNYNNLTLSYGCAPSMNRLPCNEGSSEYVYPQLGSLLPRPFCTASVVVPVSQSLVDINDFNQVDNAIMEGFVVRWIVGIEECDRCKTSGGVCGFDWYANQTCYCRDGACSNFLPDAKAPSDSDKINQLFGWLS
ncbi:LEAF RUST 10 DISEASE-RESISTANCE LOCUS RECEPTOR-LIKE PROTEIN KINASE-like 2.4 [Cajanus cajan]|uniref:LEAF RUST 10 DISEASE-RESISTANCE LOCUS RECEPTOR-LIKE PROTEIN KINASE-like 2.4 n=1 Tax=Cajanus cajan TaxID=3821 RepID=UPI0010FB6287|nr:LEAF RUST 10 DISEASE-RESISTANCE LOCUS RECEPTOR-LIKE PROTEIN KINASE-like 2.4 [Cajanus cajan]